MTTATATATQTWAIRPITKDGQRRYVAVAKDAADGTEIVRCPPGRPFATILAAREYINRSWAGGTTFPKPPTYTINVAEIDRIRAKYRTI